MSFDIWSLAIILAKLIANLFTLFSVGSFLFNLLLKPDARIISKRSTFLAIIIAIIATFALIPINVGLFNEDGVRGMLDYQIFRIVIESPIGTSTQIRILGLAILLISYFLNGNSHTILGLAASLLVAWSFTQIGHFSSVEPALVKSVLMIHLLGIAFWIGAFMPLYRAADGQIPLEKAADLSHQFGLLALYIVFGLFIAGIVMSFFLLSSPSQLYTTEYGQTLAIKFLLFLALLSLAALNKLRLVPSLRTSAPNAAERLQRSIIVEIALVSAILLITAILTTAPQLPAHH